MVLIDAQAICFSYEATPILQDISLAVAQGKITVLLGPSGCGKSTLLRLIAGFDAPTKGVIRIGGHVVSQDGRIVVPPERRQIGMVFQDLALWPHMTVRKTLDFVLRAVGCPAHERSASVEEMLAKASLRSVATAYPSQLSGGQQQLLALARAMITQPQVILMDEPLASLDVSLRQRFIETLLRLVQEEHLSLLYVTHDHEEAFTLADCVVVMSQGRLEQIGTPEAVYHRPATAFVQRFIGVTNVLDGIVVADGRVETAWGMLRCETAGVAIGEAVQLIVRAEDLQISPGEGGEIVGTVARTVYPGGGLLYIDVGQRFLKVRSRDEVPPGERVTLTVRRPPRCLRGEGHRWTT
jgi:ABC-type Fe3+/spermidine/putrescine transport system ATPase subunit